MDFDIHSALQLLGLSVCVCSSIYLIFRGQKSAGTTFLFGFVFILQANLYIHFIGLAPNQGECWATQGDFYQCQPIAEKFSFHLGHLGYLLLALGVIILARKGKQQG